jgi:hypothetical protein
LLVEALDLHLNPLKCCRSAAYVCAQPLDLVVLSLHELCRRHRTMRVGEQLLPQPLDLHPRLG